MATTKKKVGIGRHLSSIKRARQAEKRRVRNKDKVSAMRTSIKQVRLEPTAENLKKAIPVIAKTGGSYGIPKRRADRVIGRLTKLVNTTEK